MFFSNGDETHLGPDVALEHALPGRTGGGGEIVHGDHTLLRAFGDGHVALALAERERGDGLGVRPARDEPLRLRLHVVQDELVAGDVRHGGLIDVGDVVGDIALRAEDVPGWDRGKGKGQNAIDLACFRGIRIGTRELLPKRERGVGRTSGRSSLSP